MRIKSIVICIVLVSVSCGLNQEFSQTEMEKIINQNGIDEGINYYQSMRASHKSTDFNIDQLEKLAFSFYAKDKKDACLKLLLLNHENYPDSMRTSFALGKMYHRLHQRDKATEYINKALEIDSLSLPLIIFKKRLFFVPVDLNIPEQLIVDDMKIRPIKESDTNLDYKAVMSNLDHLKGALGSGWPSKDLSFEDDRKALKMHESEFAQREGFVYTVMTLDETECVGCVYIYPAKVDTFDVEVGMWVTESRFKQGYDKKLFTAVDKWLKSSWQFENIVYPGRTISWGEYYGLLGAQDEKYHQ